MSEEQQSRELVNSADWTGSGGVTIHIPSVAFVKDKIAEPGPVRWHFLTVLTNLALAFVVMVFVTFPWVWQAFIGLLFAGGCYALLHALVYQWFSRDRAPDTRDGY